MHDDWHRYTRPDANFVRPVCVQPETADRLAYMLDASIRVIRACPEDHQMDAQTVIVTQMSRLVQRLAQMQMARVLPNMEPKEAAAYREAAGIPVEDPPSGDAVQTVAFSLLISSLKFLCAICEDVQGFIAERVAVHQDGIRELIAEKAWQLNEYGPEHPQASQLLTDLKSLVEPY